MARVDRAAARRVGATAAAILVSGALAGCADELLTSETAGGVSVLGFEDGGLGDGGLGGGGLGDGGLAGDNLVTADAGGSAAAVGSGVVYSLPRAFVPMTLSRDEAGLLTLHFEESVIFPDPVHTYTLSYAADGMSADKIDIRTTPDGLLQRISTTSRDETAAVGLGLARLAGQIARAASPMGPGAAMAGGMMTQSGFESVGAPEPFSLPIMVDPTSETFSEGVSKALEHIGITDVVVERVTSAVSPERRTHGQLRAFCQQGACYRRSAPVTVRAYSTLSDGEVTETVLLPNEGVVGRIDFLRRSFVENHAEAVFEQGMLTELSYNDPSSAAAMVQAPADILESVLDIPASVFRSDASTMEAQSDALRARSQLLSERQALLDAELRLREAELAAAEARAALGQ